MLEKEQVGVHNGMMNNDYKLWLHTREGVFNLHGAKLCSMLTMGKGLTGTTETPNISQ